MKRVIAMKLHNFTSIGRTIDPRYSTNLAIFILAAIVTIAGAIKEYLAGTVILDSGVWGILAGITTFFAWALCRELDPDHELSAFIAAGLGILGLLFFQL